MSEWISVKERLPDSAKEEDYKAYLTYPHYKVRPWYEGAFWEFDNIAEEMIAVPSHRLSYWMPLPPPPKEEA